MDGRCKVAALEGVHAKQRRGIMYYDEDYEYKQALNQRGVTCPSCEGRGGVGHSFAGITLSYKTCSCCYGYGVVLDDKFKRGSEVKLLSGKYKGLVGSIECYVDRHYLSDKNRLQVKVQTGNGFKTLLVNEDNLEIVEDMPNG